MEYASQVWRLIPFWFNNWERHWGAECSSMVYELPHYCLELLVILPCIQVSNCLLWVHSLEQACQLPRSRLQVSIALQFPSGNITKLGLHAISYPLGVLWACCHGTGCMTWMSTALHTTHLAEHAGPGVMKKLVTGHESLCHEGDKLVTVHESLCMSPSTKMMPASGVPHGGMQHTLELASEECVSQHCVLSTYARLMRKHACVVYCVHATYQGMV